MINSNNILYGIQEYSTTYSKNTETLQQMASNILGDIQWISEYQGFCECPGKKQHTRKNGNRDCIVYLDNIPTINCRHSSCREFVDKANGDLRHSLRYGEFTGKSHKLSEAEKQTIARRENEKQIMIRAACSKERLLKDYHWPYESICNDSPEKLDSNIEQHWKLLLSLYNQEDILWIGGIHDSGKDENVLNFREVKRWLLEKTHAPAQYICPSTFHPQSKARSNDNVLERKFLVVESDVLNKDQVGAIFRWLDQKAQLGLRAIVDTAGKSLHGWFEFPDEGQLSDLQLILPHLDCDPKLFTASQPVRLPGAMREGKQQKLIYFTGKEAK